MSFPPSIQLWTGYGHPNETGNGGINPSVDTLAHRVTQFIEQGFGYGNLGQAYRSANPGNVLVLTYFLHLEVQRQGVPWWSGNQMCRNANDWNVLAADPRSFLYSTQAGALSGDPNARLYFTNDYGVLVPFAYLDPASTTVRNFQRDAVNYLLANQPGTFGVWWDNVNNTLKGASKHSPTGRVFSGTGEEYTDVSFRAQVIAALTAVKAAITRPAGNPGLFGGNIIHMVYSSALNPAVPNTKYTDYVDALDLAHDESYGGYPWVINSNGTNGERSAEWMDFLTQNAMDWLALSPTKLFSYAMQASTANQNDLQRLNYALGTAALIQPADNWITINGIRTARVVTRWTRAQTYYDWWERPELDIDLGTKTGTPTKTGPGVWTVAYSKSTVTVDHNAHNASFTTSGTPTPPGAYGVRKPYHVSEPMGNMVTLFHGDDVAQDDEMLAIVASRHAQSTFTPLMPGWNFVGVIRSTSAINIHVFRKRAAAGDVGNQFYSFETEDSSEALFGGIVAYPGIDATNPIAYLKNTTTPAVLGVTGHGTKPLAPAMTPEDDIVLINIYALAWGFADLTGPQGVNPRFIHRNSEAPITVGVFDQRFAGDADTGPKEATTNATGTYAAMSIGLKLSGTAPVGGSPQIMKELATTALHNDATGTNTFNVTRHSTLVKNDMMYLYVGNRNTNPGGTARQKLNATITGAVWELIGEVHRDFSFSGRLYRRAVGDNEPTQYTITLTNAADGTAHVVDAGAFILPVRNYHPTSINGPVMAGSNSAAATGTTQPIVHTSVDAAINDVHVLIAHMAGQLASFTPPTNYLEQLDFGLSGVDLSFTASAKVVTANGQTGAQTTTGSYLASHAHMSFVIKGAPAITAPDKSAGISGSISPGSEGQLYVNLSWLALDRADSIHVEMSVFSGPFIPVPGGSTLAGSSTGTRYELPPGSYQFRIYGSNQAGNGPYSDPFTVHIQAPLTVAVKLHPQGVEVSWTPSRMRDTIIRIYRAIVDDFGAPGEYELAYQAPTDVLPEGRYIDTTMKVDTPYIYMVESYAYDRPVYSRTASPSYIIVPGTVQPPDPPPISYDPSEEFAVALMSQNVYHSLTDGTMSEVTSYSGMEYPERDRREIQAPYEDGVTTVGFSLKPRKFILTFQLYGRTPEELEAKRLRFLDLFEPTDDEITLRFDTVSGRVLLIDAFVDRMVEGEVNKLSLYFRRVVLSFHADDPAFYELENVVVPFSISVGSEGMDVPLEIPWAVGSDELDMRQNISYNGHAYVHPKIVISGPISNLKIANETAGTEIAFRPDFTIAEGETYTIDTSASYLQVVDQNGEDRTDSLDEDTDLGSFVLHSPKKVPGGVNVIRVTGSNANEVTRIYLFYRTRWLAL